MRTAVQGMKGRAGARERGGAKGARKKGKRRTQVPKIRKLLREQ